MRFSAKPRAGFTLVELLVSIAIVAILSAIMIGGLSQQKNFSLARRAAEQIQNDIQTMQNSALSGQTVNGTRPAGFGIRFLIPSYITFADLTTYPSPNFYDSNPSPGEPVISNSRFDSSVRISCLQTNLGGSLGRIDVVYQQPSGAVSIKTSQVGTITNATITVKNTVLNICYAVTVTQASGTVSTRQLTSCTCT